MKPMVTSCLVHGQECLICGIAAGFKLRIVEDQRDEAIREVERLRSLPIMDASRCYHGDESIVVCNLKVALEAEKRRTAAYREVACELHQYKFQRDIELQDKWDGKSTTADDVDAEAQKLLTPSDSGGEK